MLQVCRWQAGHRWGVLLWAGGKLSPVKPLSNLLGADQSPPQPGLSALGEASPCFVLPQQAWLPTAPASQPTSPAPHWGCGRGDVGVLQCTPHPALPSPSVPWWPGGGPGDHSWQQGHGWRGRKSHGEWEMSQQKFSSTSLPASP